MLHLRQTALAVLLVLCSAQAAHAAPVGIWYGEGQPDDPNVVYLDQFNEDGTFKSEFRKFDRCEVVWQQVEEGQWTEEDGVITTVTTIANGKPILGFQQYRNEGQSAFEIRLRHLESDYLFIEHRIDRFEFPACFIGS